MIFYGIRHKKTKRPLGFSCESNIGCDQESCSDVSFELDEGATNIYLTILESNAARALSQDVKWYNSCSDFPAWPAKNWDNHNYEVFSVSITSN